MTKAKAAAPAPAGVEIMLAGKPVLMKPSRKALAEFSKRYNGIVGTVSLLNNFNFEVLAVVVAIGIGKPPRGTQFEELKDQIYEAGLHEVMPKAIEFVGLVSTGGKPADEDAISADLPDVPLQTEAAV